MFITFEGGEGAGKTTLINRIEEALLARGVAVLKTRAPGGTAAGALIRDILLHKYDVSLTHRSELFLFLSDRSQHVEEIIRPALAEQQVVLCDRFNDSTVAYQGVARNLDASWVKKLCDFACSNLKPDLTFYLDLDPKIAFSRMNHRSKDRIESEDLSFHETIRRAFLKIAEEEPERFHVLDAAKTPDELFNEVMDVLAPCR